MKKGNIISNNGVDYSLIESIGDGGSGVVWKAQANGQDFAIKFLKKPEEPKKIEPNKIERFKKELLFCKNTQNKYIVPIIADGEFEGQPYYVMPLYPKTLRNVIKDEKDASVLINYIFQLCNAIKFIHKHKDNVIHRDIKPENILLDGKKLVLADFGIAHFKDSSLTKNSDLLANRNYAAPEQRIKNNANNIDKSADIYALGLIINECFTKEVPTGSNYKIIADSYLLYYELDILVSNMIKQNPNERFSIDIVIAELKFIYGMLKTNLKEIKEVLLEDNYPQNISQKTLSKILQRASEDLLFAKGTFKIKSAEEIRKLNHNWHMKIGYSADSFLVNLCMQENILAVCLGKFLYESNSKSPNPTLNLDKNTSHKALFNQLRNYMEQYPLKYGFEDRFDLSGRIFKYFTSCYDYHCAEILNHINSKDFLRKKENLINAPILWIISYLKTSIAENSSLLAEIDLIEHIRINWDRTQSFNTNEDDIEIIDCSYADKEIEIIRIMEALKKQWKIVYCCIDDNYYSIKFKTFKQFAKFRGYALNISKHNYIFEGDVIEIINQYSYVNGIVDLKIGKIFDIPYTLAKILGLRDLN